MTGPFAFVALRSAARLSAALFLVAGAVPARAQAPSNPDTTVMAARVDQSAQAQAGVEHTPSNADTGFVAFFKRVQISGFADIYYAYNFNTPATNQSQLRNFDVRHNSFSLNLAELALEKKPTADSRAGFRIDLDYGATTSLVHASEPGGLSVYQNVGQAYVSYLASAGKGLQFDVGEFLSPVGNEVVKTKDNWNYSRSLLFTLGEPYYHMGVRATYAFSDSFTLSGHVVNGWNDVVDNNTGKTFGVQATLRITPKVTVAEMYMAGPEQPNDNSHWRHMSNTNITYTATTRVSLVGSYDHGRDHTEGLTVTWQGVAGYLRFQPNAWFALSPRLEYYDDADGFTTGTPQKLKELTVTGELKQKDGLILRVEYRHDFSDVPFFRQDEADLVRRQPTLTVGVIYAFSSGGH